MADRSRTAARQDQRDRGSATAETAVALPAVVVAVSAVLAVGQVVVAQVQCVDAARAAARAVARGDSEQVARVDAAVAAGTASGATEVSVRRSGGATDVRVARWVRVLGGPRVRVSASAVARDERADSAPALRDVGGHDAGSAVLLVVGAMAFALLGVLLVAGVGAAVVARHQARSAADLAALAAADVLVGRAAGDPCDRARSVTGPVGARLESCTTAGGEATVTISVAPVGPAARLGRARAVARAGPTSSAQTSG